jgi:hypothetical protein
MMPDHAETPGAEIQQKKGRMKTSGANGEATSEIDEAGTAAAAGVAPEELPEEAQTPQTVRPAAAAEKFATFTAMRHDPSTSLVQARKRLVTIPARSPDKAWFVRTSLNPEHSGILPLYWDKSGDGRPFLIAESVQDYFGNDVRNNYCVLSVTRQQMFFLWCSPLEDQEGNWNPWHSSAHDMKALAATAWIRVKSNKQLGGYEPFDPIGSQPPDPEWPDISWGDIVRLAFRRHLVEMETHPLINRLMRG